jgi:hypothetical protein
MKFRVTFKAPDAVSDSARVAAEDQARRILAPAGPELDAREETDLAQALHDDLLAFAGKWVEYGEYVTVEFDTDAGTATVVPVQA